MKHLKGHEIRKMWLDFFESKGHQIIESAPLVPINDPTLLWINAGITPLKKYFDGREIPTNKRMANAQKSIRTNDIENVGKTARHHTFFEMLGNFSVGDYFRDEALTWGFEILTSPKWYGFDLDKLYFTVYPTDTESVDKWIELGVSEDHIIALEGNFWEIGDGPCGPDTEIFYDRGEKYDSNQIGIDLLKKDIENDRYIEVWNIVFSQYNAVEGLTRDQYKELPSKNIDTGMGLERMACVMQEVETNYDTDLFMPIIEKTEQLTKIQYTGQMAFKVIADHVRSVTFAVSDGAVLSNEGRGYVLRRILRRAVRYGKKLGMNQAFLYQLVHVVANHMSDYYPYLLDTASDVARIIKQEEEKFLLTLESGEKRLLEFIHHSESKTIPKEVSFLLYDTFGFPFELTLEVAEEHGFQVDEAGFKEELQKQKERARSSRAEEQSMNIQNEAMLKYTDESRFVGYERLSTDATIVAIFTSENRVEKTSEDALFVFDQTPFYAESGGQIGDVGIVQKDDSSFEVFNTIKLPNGQHASLLHLDGHSLQVGDRVFLQVGEEFRIPVVKNHSATHLLNETLRKVLGKHVVQQGSNVSNVNMRFDFNHFTNVSSEELLEIEERVNQEIAAGHDVEIREMPLDEAKAMNVQAVFGEKYGEVVRVINMDYSKELCGGTHVSNTKDIGRFAIVNYESKGSGVFRIEGTTDQNIIKELKQRLEPLEVEIQELLRKKEEISTLANQDNVTLPSASFTLSDPIPSYAWIVNRRKELAMLREQVKDQEKTYHKLNKETHTIPLEDYLDQVESINGKSVLITEMDNQEIEVVKDFVDRISDYLKESVIFVANRMQDKVLFICKNKISSLQAGALVKQAAIITNGNGGGRPDFAQAGGKDVTKIGEALAAINKMIGSSL